MSERKDQAVQYSGRYQIIQKSEDINQEITKPKMNKIKGKLKKMVNETSIPHKQTITEQQTQLKKQNQQFLPKIQNRSYQNLHKNNKIGQISLNSQQCNKPQFNLIRKRSPQSIQAQTLKFNRRKIYSQNHVLDFNNKKVQTLYQLQVKQDKIKHPLKYQILQNELRLSQKEIFLLKNSQINYQLQKIAKNKGVQYLKEVNIKIKQKNYGKLERLKTDADTSQHCQTNHKYINYIPQVFGKIRKLSPQKERENELKSQKQEKQKKINLLTSKEQMLGKLVLQKVQKHIRNDKEPRINYFSRVKSQETIDDSLIQFLKTKIEKAQMCLQK